MPEPQVQVNVYELLGAKEVEIMGLRMQVQQLSNALMECSTPKHDELPKAQDPSDEIAGVAEVS